MNWVASKVAISWNVIAFLSLCFSSYTCTFLPVLWYLFKVVVECNINREPFFSSEINDLHSFFVSWNLNSKVFNNLKFSYVLHNIIIVAVPCSINSLVTTFSFSLFSLFFYSCNVLNCSRNCDGSASEKSNGKNKKWWR